MNDALPDVLDSHRLSRPARTAAAPRRLSLQKHLCILLVAAGAFALYSYSAHTLHARQAPQYFGADNCWYVKLAHGEVVDRIARFHPTTIAIALAWMKALSPLAALVSPQILLSLMFAAIGAMGSWAATWAFAAVLPFREALLWGGIYSVSFGVWFFASVEESKILSATMAAIYIGGYLHLRQRWTRHGAALLTIVLLLACLNEIALGALIVVPLIDTMLRKGWNWRHYPWMALHATAGVIALLLLEFVVNGLVIARDHDPEGSSHLVLFFHYFAKADHSLASLYAFLLNWLSFNLVAPTPNAPHYFGGDPTFGAYFAPSFMDYFGAPASASAILMILAAAALALGVGLRGERPRAFNGLVPALAMFSLLRALFFFLFNPVEPLLFSPAVTLAHLLILAGPISVANIPRKELFLAGLLMLLIAANSRFFVG